VCLLGTNEKISFKASSDTKCDHRRDEKRVIRDSSLRKQKSASKKGAACSKKGSTSTRALQGETRVKVRDLVRPARRILPVDRKKPAHTAGGDRQKKVHLEKRRLTTTDEESRRGGSPGQSSRTTVSTEKRESKIMARGHGERGGESANLRKGHREEEKRLCRKNLFRELSVSETRSPPPPINGVERGEGNCASLRQEKRERSANFRRVFLPRFWGRDLPISGGKSSLGGEEPARGGKGDF